MRSSQLPDMAHLFRALADPTRLRILGLLVTGEVCVCHIHDALGVPQPTASRHLAYLRKAGLVAARKDGLRVHYRLADGGDEVTRAIKEAVQHALGHVAQVGKDLVRLQRKTGCCLPETPAKVLLPCCASTPGLRE
jgi:ArsR family transcriptional regulator, arsenate/arsenite/antimonite-responsive transcriptional repressor